MKKKDTFWTIVSLPYIYLALGFIFLYVGLNVYFDGYHGVDLMFNRCLIGLMMNDSKIWNTKKSWISETVKLQKYPRWNYTVVHCLP